MLATYCAQENSAITELHFDYSHPIENILLQEIRSVFSRLKKLRIGLYRKNKHVNLLDAYRELIELEMFCTYDIKKTFLNQVFQSNQQREKLKIQARFASLPDIYRSIGLKKKNSKHIFTQSCARNVL